MRTHGRTDGRTDARTDARTDGRTEDIPAQRAPAEKRGFGMKLLEIAADGDGFRQDRSVVQFEDRQSLQGIATGYLRAAMPHRTHVHRLERHIDALLGQKNAYPARIGRLASVEQFQPISPIPAPIDAIVSSPT